MKKSNKLNLSFLNFRYGQPTSNNLRERRKRRKSLVSSPITHFHYFNQYFKVFFVQKLNIILSPFLASSTDRSPCKPLSSWTLHQTRPSSLYKLVTPTQITAFTTLLSGIEVSFFSRKLDKTIKTQYFSLVIYDSLLQINGQFRPIVHQI